MNYMKTNEAGLVKSMNAVYNWESAGKALCLRKSYPATSSYNNWDKCLGFAASFLVADRHFE